MVDVVGHRGCAERWSENTLLGFRRAIALGVDAVECDVQMSADGAAVIVHDDCVDRTTDGSGAVADMTLAQLRRLDFGRGERIPTLAEVLELFGDAGTRLLWS